MTRIALLTVSLALAPVLAAAQVPPPPPLPPAAPLPAPMAPMAPMPAPAPVPTPAPFPPQPPMAPFPADVFHFEMPAIDIDLSALRNLDIDLSHLRDLDFTHIQDIVRDMQIAQVDTAAVQRQVEAAQRQAETLRREALVSVERQFSGNAYDGGLNALQRREYERAIEAFDRVITAANARADAALYWKAFAEFRLARIDAALKTIAELQKAHAQSRYLGDARVLEAEVRKQSGQKIDPAQLDDDEIKLLAIQGLERTEQVVPLLEAVLNAANSLNVKRRALYVLAVRSEPRAREVLLRYARGGGNPDLQMEGVRLLVSRRDAQTTDAVLRELYESSSDTAVRRVIIDAYATRSRVARGFTGSGNQGFGGTGYAQAATAGGATPQSTTAPQELVALYQRETDPELRRHIASVLVSTGSIDQVVTLIRAEREPRMRQSAIRTLTARNNPQAAKALTDLYGTFTDTETREAIISALAGQRNAESLIALARAETNVALKTRIVRHLSEMAQHSQAAADYLMDVIR